MDFKIGFIFLLIAMITVPITINSLNKWDQSEETSRPGSRDNSFYYDGIDTYHGFGIGFNQKNFTVSIEHQDHDMYYDAKSTSASLKYNF